MSSLIGPSNTQNLVPESYYGPKEPLSFVNPVKNVTHRAEILDGALDLKGRARKVDHLLAECAELGRTHQHKMGRASDWDHKAMRALGVFVTAALIAAFVAGCVTGGVAPSIVAIIAGCILLVGGMAVAAGDELDTKQHISDAMGLVYAFGFGPFKLIYNLIFYSSRQEKFFERDRTKLEQSIIRAGQDVETLTNYVKENRSAIEEFIQKVDDELAASIETLGPLGINSDPQDVEKCSQAMSTREQLRKVQARLEESLKVANHQIKEK